jgi:ANTAR domain
MPEGSDQGQGDTSTDGSPGSEIAAEIPRLTLYADAQARTVAELEVTVMQLRSALESRVAIERAVGMLSERFDLAIPDSFELLRSAARHSRREARALAAELTKAREETPAEIADAYQRMKPG